MLKNIKHTLPLCFLIKEKENVYCISLGDGGSHSETHWSTSELYHIYTPNTAIMEMEKVEGKIREEIVLNSSKYKHWFFSPTSVLLSSENTLNHFLKY